VDAGREKTNRENACCGQPSRAADAEPHSLTAEMSGLPYVYLADVCLQRDVVGISLKPDPTEDAFGHLNVKCT
jgi:hypothetical protein